MLVLRRLTTPARGTLAEMAADQRFFVRRLRWRLRGAWQWPAFAVLTVGDGLIMHLLPFTPGGVDLAWGVIVASFTNLFLIGAVAPWLARRLARREQARASVAGGVPIEVLQDRAATALLAAGAVGLVAAGLAARPTIVSETEATERNARLVREYVLAHGNPEVTRNLDTANTIRLSENYFRTCIAADDRTRAFCYLVDTGSERGEIQEDPNRAPNAEFSDR